LPSGKGLFAFSQLEEIVEAVETINADYVRQSDAALEIGREYFGSDFVLRTLLSDLDVTS
jgi:hypothetical protein